MNFTVEEGEIVGLIAPSGYGKSTLAKILSGYMKPEQGEVVLEEKGPDGNDIPVQTGKGYNPVQLILQHPERR